MNFFYDFFSISRSVDQWISYRIQALAIYLLEFYNICSFWPSLAANPMIT